VQRERLVTPQGATVGDRILLTKGVPIEATAVLAREVPDRLSDVLNPAELAVARAFLHKPGISVLRDARVAMEAGRVTAMHDPTEGGLSTALWELSEASVHSLFVDPATVPVPAIGSRVCRALKLDPLAALASGALLLTAPADDALRIRRALEKANIPCAEIGWVEEGPPAVWRKIEAGRESWPRPERDEIARVFEPLQTAGD
jgi:hydrogenase maturation factor